MVLMKLGDKFKYVPDALVASYRSRGYIGHDEQPTEVVDDPVSEVAEEEEPEVEVEEVVEEAPCEKEDEQPTEVVDDPVSEKAKPEYFMNEDGKWQCPYCDNDYSTKDNLKRHIATKHPDKEL